MTLVAGKPSLACVVITKNEEANIRDCPESIRWADELIVVDAESSDRAAELARGGGERMKQARCQKACSVCFQLCLSWKTSY